MTSSSWPSPREGNSEASQAMETNKISVSVNNLCSRLASTLVMGDFSRCKLLRLRRKVTASLLARNRGLPSIINLTNAKLINSRQPIPTHREARDPLSLMRLPYRSASLEITRRCMTHGKHQIRQPNTKGLLTQTKVTDLRRKNSMTSSTHTTSTPPSSNHLGNKHLPTHHCSSRLCKSHPDLLGKLLNR